MPDLRNVPWPRSPEFDAALRPELTPESRTLLEKYREEDWDAGRIDWDMRLAGAWAKRWGVRVVVNEFGDFKPFSPPESRVRWLRDVRVAIEKQKFGWAVWDYAAGFDLTVVKDGARAIDPAVSMALGLAPGTVPEPVRSGAPPLFSSIRPVQVGEQPDTSGYADGILAADVNADGWLDLVIAPMTYPELPGHAVQVFLNDGGGILRPGLFDGTAPVQRSVLSIVAGRFDKSGRPGFFLPDKGPGDGSGAQSGLILPAGRDLLRDATANLPRETVSTLGAAAGDVDGDGVDDIAVLRAHGVELLRNDGRGNSGPIRKRFRRGLPIHSRRIIVSCAGRLCGGAIIGRRICWCSGRAVRQAAFSWNDGAGEFHDGTLLPQPAVNGGPVAGGCAAVADLDGDGLDDAIVAYAEVIQILMNNGDGTFRDANELPIAGGRVRRIALAGGVLVVTRVGLPPIVMMHRGSGVFVDSGWKAAGSPWVVAPGDFNRDGLVDLVFGQGGGAPVLARFGQGRAALK